MHRAHDAPVYWNARIGKSVGISGRPRSTSVDTVPLRRESPSLIALTELPVTAAKLKNGKLTSPEFRRSRKSRAMSVPNTRPASASSARVDPDEYDGAPHDERAKRLFELAKTTGVTSEEESSELDCDDTHSESTSDSSCSSPRHSAATSQFTVQHDPSHVGMSAHVDPMDDFADFMTPDDEAEEEDYEAYMLLDRINSLSAEFKAHREYEEASALACGAWEESRDVLYHKCHLVPAVGSVTETAGGAQMNDSVEESFVQCVDALSPTDSADARHRKLRVLKLLSDLLTKWVKIIGYERGLSEEHVALTSGSLFLAGPYRLGFNDPLSDIDAVSVVPWHVTHEDFFSSFCSLLGQTSGVTQLAPVPNAYVPLISLGPPKRRVCRPHAQQPLDLSLVADPASSTSGNGFGPAEAPRFATSRHHEMLASSDLLPDHDQDARAAAAAAAISDGHHTGSTTTARSPTTAATQAVTAPRQEPPTTAIIHSHGDGQLSLEDHAQSIVLRAVRAWARRRGIYSSKLGYLGGISCVDHGSRLF